ncbi:tRNA isopentenyltransferas-like protein [Massariosphaeria phaeospora]|uniref:tRNA dimethylallyltransferase n=1 Tax=Massariosphaeria phaeospora TaxID=100035 RepID=A0A7C8I2P2_9PLEO|nr:tRNA isopentenyltransferas-like protein [Massariosphaeria phaeospora]
MATAPTKPLVAIIGATGTGKSDLAVELARRYNGEIINGDAMQLYQGLPIITNKITQEEMKGVSHHLLGCIGLEEETWTVGKFVGKALRVIEEIRSRGKLPILVGGTHYYTQSLLFHDALSDEPALEFTGHDQKYPVLDESTEVILERLKKADPLMAARWHPNDRRKIQRSLEIYLRTGKPASQVYDQQRLKQEVKHDGVNEDFTSQDGDSLGLRFPTLLLWVHASRDILHPRLDARIAKMLSKGLLSEVETLTNFRASHEASTGSEIDQSRGIWVSIGYKEFLSYQAELSDSTSLESELECSRIAAVEKTQAATRQYANRQVRWIRIKLLNALISAGQKNNMFLLDGSHLTNWEHQVLQPAHAITESFLTGHPLPDPTEQSEAAREMLTPKRNYDLGQRPDLWQQMVCETCGTVAVTQNDWSFHIKSRGHRRAVGVKKKKEHVARSQNKELRKLQVDVVDILEAYQNGLAMEESVE